MVPDPERTAPPLPPAAAVGSVIHGKYRVDRVLGQGGMGLVVEAWHLQLRERVAVKLLLPELAPNPEALERFAMEARAAFRLKSEHVARVLDVGTIDEATPFMVMEFLDGTDLGDLLRERGHLSITEAVRHVLQAASAVAEAHSVGIVHRDLKPENLYLARQPGGEPAIKVLDFGISKRAEGPVSQRSRNLTGADALMGSPLYMAPEQWTSARDVGPRADLWSLGVILFELIAGRPPFAAREIARLCAQVLNEPAPSLTSIRPMVPSELDAVVARCLAKDERERFDNVAELCVALLPWSDEDGRLAARRAVHVLQAAGKASSTLSVTAVEAGAHSSARQLLDGLDDTVDAESTDNGGANGTAQTVGVATHHPWQLTTVAPRPRRRIVAVGVGLTLLVLLAAAVWSVRQLPSAASDSAQASPAGVGDSSAVATQAAGDSNTPATEAVSAAGANGAHAGVETATSPFSSAVPASSGPPSTASGASPPQSGQPGRAAVGASTSPAAGAAATAPASGAARSAPSSRPAELGNALTNEM